MAMNFDTLDELFAELEEATRGYAEAFASGDLEAIKDADERLRWVEESLPMVAKYE